VHSRNRRELTGGGPYAHPDDGVAVEARHLGEVAAEERPNLSRDRVEELARRRVLRHERDHAPQRGVFVGQLCCLGTRLGVRDLRHRDHAPSLRAASGGKPPPVGE